MESWADPGGKFQMLNVGIRNPTHVGRCAPPPPDRSATSRRDFPSSLIYRGRSMIRRRFTSEVIRMQTFASSPEYSLCLSTRQGQLTGIIKSNSESKDLAFRQWLEQGIQNGIKKKPAGSVVMPIIPACAWTIQNAMDLVRGCDSSCEYSGSLYSGLRVTVNAADPVNGLSPCQVYLDNPFVCLAAALASPGSSTKLPLPSHLLTSSLPCATSFLAFVLSSRDVLRVFRLCICPFWISWTF